MERVGSVLNAIAELEGRVGEASEAQRFTVRVRFKHGAEDRIEDGSFAMHMGAVWAVITEDYRAFYGPTLALAYAAYARAMARMCVEMARSALDRYGRYGAEVDLQLAEEEVEEAREWLRRAELAASGEAVFELEVR